MTSPHRTAFAVHPVRRVGSWLSDHRQHYARARFGLAELGRAVDDVLAVWPVDGGEALEVDQGPAGLHELCLKRDIFADAVVLLSAMSVEAFLNYYGVVRLGERQFYAHFEMLGAEKKLRVLLLTCDGLAVEYPDPLVAALRTVMGRRNRLAHPKAKEVAGDVPLFAFATTCSCPGQRHRHEHVMTRLQTALVACLAALACGDAPPPSMPDGVAFHVMPLSIREADLDRLGPLRLRGAVAMQSRNGAFGSYSGLHVSDDGTRLIAIGWGSWLVGRLGHGPAGNLTGFELEGVFPLRDAGGRPITDDADKDAEGLVEREGNYYVGFETNSRVARYRGIDAAAEPMNLPPGDLAAIPKCCGFSSVVFTARHELLALTEGARDSAGNVKGWLWQNGRAEALSLREEPRWLPVDIALLPNGDLLLVEVREDLWSERWHSRFSRIADADVQSGGRMPTHPLGELYSADHPDRIEGIHARKGSRGETLIYAISDSRRGWPTNLLMFELEDR